MKYPQDQFETLVRTLAIVLNAYGIHPREIDPENVGLLNTLHFKVFVQLDYPDDNLNILKVDGKRLIEPADFKIYPDGCNDNHVETAMKRAVKILQAN